MSNGYTKTGFWHTGHGCADAQKTTFAFQENLTYLQTVEKDGSVGHSQRLFNNSVILAEVEEI